MRRIVCAALCSVTLLTTLAFGQNQPAGEQADDVLRINTELVQTSVMVFDRQGRFVEGLKPEQFELRVDGKPVQLSFFERVIAGTINEEKLMERAASGASSSTSPSIIPATTSSRGRTIIFFIDDLHLSAESVDRTRKTILEFVENQMGPSDQVAIASASGQIGFLQQFTDTKPVLRAAIARLNHRPYTVRDAENITMTEYSALRIDQGDRDATDYYVEELLKATNYRNPGGTLGPPPSSPYGGKTDRSQSSGLSREAATRIVKERAAVMLKQSAAVTINTLDTLESLMRTSSQLPGRKLVFFISDGFYLNDRNTGFGDKLKQITDAATRAGVVIYTIDARGLVSMTDSTSNRADPQGRLSRSNIGELSSSQDPLTALAGDTGGRALLNAGALSPAVVNALKETSNYYLLAWRPSTEEQKGGGYKRIEISIANRPDLTVRLPKGFLSGQPKTTAKGTETAAADNKSSTPAPAKGTEAALMSALNVPKKGLPTQLSVSFVDVPGSGLVLTTSMQMATDVLGYGPDGKQAAAIDLAGVILNDQGKQVGGFKNRLNVNPLSADAKATSNPGVIYNHKLPLKPGIYQVRVAARDAASGRVGSAAKWIEIPDLASRRLALSSLLIGGQFVGSGQKQGSEQVQFSVDRRFTRGSHLNFLTIIYNAARDGNALPDLESQIQISRDGQTIVTSPLRKVSLDQGADMARIPYGADIALQNLPAGRYVLLVKINDRKASASATQLTTFDIE
ncbi:MAG TPA: VWA domain-containing protein [Pyrinomonadaceae bacterium]